MKRLTTEEVIKKFVEVHGDKYDYSKVKYVNALKKVIISCKEHGDFEQTPNNHLLNKNCKKCYSERQLSTYNTFVYKANKIHNFLYDYKKFTYINSRTKGIIICKKHGDFEQRPNNHLFGQGCNKCANEFRLLTTKQFIKKAKKVHGNKYDYSEVVYINNKTKVIIGCKEHGDFEQTPCHHLNGSGCKYCHYDNITSTTKNFIQKARLIHGDKYDYSKVVYVNAHTRVIIGCKEHGEFKQTPSDHLNGSGCYMCITSNIFYSKKAITWLNQLTKEQNIHIHHAENTGEYHIPGTRYKADGYCSSNNTIYEFYGDRFHGNPNLFEENYKCHPFNNKTAGSLYTKTKQREQEIKDLGYNLITIWEEDYVQSI